MLQPAPGIRTKRYRNQVFSKVTDEQLRWLNESAEKQNKKPSEFIRELIQAAMNRQAGDDLRSLMAEIVSGQALLQCVRTELLSIGATIAKRDPKELKTMSESVALADLDAFKDRLMTQAATRRSLTAERK